MGQPTLKQIYHSFMDVEHTVEGSSVDLDYVFCELITQILEIPGMREGALVAALKIDQTGGYINTRTNCERLGDVPFQFIWDYLMNPDEILPKEES